MGLLGKPKTSTDYLKEIAKSQKNQEQAARESAEAARIEARAQADVANAQASAIRAANLREKLDYNKDAFEKCKAELEQFYTQFEYNINDLDDVERKCMNIVRWIDKVDRKFKNSPAEFDIYGNDNTEKVYNDDKSKYRTLMKLLREAVEYISSSNVDKTRFAFIISKYNAYNEIEKTEQENRRRRRNTTIKVSLFVVSLVVIIGAILIVIPYPKTDDDDCKALVYKNIEKGNLQKAKKYIFNYKYSNLYIVEATNALIDAFVKCGDLEQAKATFELLDSGCYNISLGEALIAKGQYDEANKYWRSVDCHNACIKNMCENNQFDEARRYVKRVSATMKDQKERAEWVKNMNQIINSYQ